MQQKFAVAFRAQDGRFYDLNSGASELLHRARNFVGSGLLHLRVAHDTAFAHLSTASFELRLYQDDELEIRSSGTNTTYNRRKNEGGRDKRHVYRHQADTDWVSILPDLFRSEVARVGLFQQANSRVAAQSGVHLAVAGVDRDHSRCTRLKKTVGEAARRRADVQTGLTRNIDGPIFERTRQLQPAAANIRHFVAEEAEDDIALNAGAGFFQLLLVHQHSAREDERLRALTRGHQAAFHQQLVEAQLHGDRLAR